MALYSWRPDRRATKAHIRYFVKEALERKAWAAKMPEKWDASIVSQQMLADYRTQSVYQMARKALDYARLRAYMRGAYPGYPGDKPAYTLWQSLLEENERQAA